MTQKLQRPFRVVEHAEAFEVQDAGGMGLAFFYFEDEETRRSIMRRPTKAQASWLARNFARLPELVDGARAASPTTAGALSADQARLHGEG